MFSLLLNVFVCIILCIILIGLIIGIYGNIKLFQSRKQPFMEKRSLSIIFGLNISIMLGMLTSIGVIVTQYLNYNLSYYIFITLCFASWFFIFLFLNIDAFSIHFRYKWQYYALQSKWQEIINPSYVKQLNENNWYIRTNSTWSKYSNIYKLFGIIHSVNFVIAALLLFVRQNIDKSDYVVLTFFVILESIIFILPFIIYIVIVFKTPTFDDIFFIHWQSRMEAKLSVILVVIFLFQNIIATINGELTLIHTLIFVSITVITLFILLCISTFMIKYKTDNDQHKMKLKMERVMTETPDTKDGGSSDLRIKLDSILSNDQCLNIFMNHLSREYSMECLLSYIEFDQFQKFIIKSANSVLKKHAMGSIAEEDEGCEEDEDCDEDEDCEDHSNDGLILVNDKRINNNRDCRLNSIPDIDTMITLRNVPKSIIVEAQSSLKSDVGVDEKTLHDVKKKAHLLYEKYIKIGSEFEINISASMRKGLMDILDNKEELMNGVSGKNLRLADIILMFENPKKEMRMLLQYSFTRMKSTSQYKNIVIILRGKDSPI